MNPTTKAAMSKTKINRAAVIRRETMNRLNFKTVAFTLSVFLTFSYLVCVIYGLIFHEFAMHQAWEALLPGFYWLTWGTFFLGFIETIIYGIYIALVIVPLYNFFQIKFNSRNGENIS